MLYLIAKASRKHANKQAVVSVEILNTGLQVTVLNGRSVSFKHHKKGNYVCVLNLIFGKEE